MNVLRGTCFGDCDWIEGVADYGSVPLNNPRQLQESFGFARYLCSSPFIEVNTNVEQRYKNAQLNCAEVEPPVYFRWDLMGDL